MATISGGSKHTRALATVNTVRTETLFDEQPETITERWVLRSDGAVLHRLVSYGPVGGKQHRPSTGFAIKGKVREMPAPGAAAEALLTRVATARGGRQVVAA